VKKYAVQAGRRSVPVVVTSFMGEAGKRLCDDAQVSWFDLSGNAHIVAPGLRIHVEGKPNKFGRRERPSTAFAPKSARLARRLLIEPTRWFRQQELARETGLDPGFTSKIVRRIEQDALVERDKAGAIHVSKPRGLRKSKIQHAATGLAAAWLQTEFAGFRLVTFFVGSQPNATLLKEVGFRIIAPGLRLAFLDSVKVMIEGRTIRDEQARRQITVCGPGAFVVMKALAAAHGQRHQGLRWLRRRHPLDMH
jgi:hypothetical protein